MHVCIILIIFFFLLLVKNWHSKAVLTLFYPALSVQVKERAGQLKLKTQAASEKTVQMYENVQQKTEAAMEQAKAVEKINQFTQAILEISSQTNLLALNASISMS